LKCLDLRRLSICLPEPDVAGGAGGAVVPSRRGAAGQRKR